MYSAKRAFVGKVTAKRPKLPGEVLSGEYMAPNHLTQVELARRLKVPRKRINEIVVGVRAITTDTAFRLARFFRTKPEFWLELQYRWDLWYCFVKNQDNYKKLRAIKTSPINTGG